MNVVKFTCRINGFLRYQLKFDVALMLADLAIIFEVLTAGS
jgi:hypothetical protein